MRIRIEWIDLDVAHPVRLVPRGIRRGGVIPGGFGAQGHPSGRHLCAAENLVANVPAVEGGDHEGAGAPGIKRQAGIAKLVITGRLDRQMSAQVPAAGLNFQTLPSVHTAWSEWLPYAR